MLRCAAWGKTSSTGIESAKEVTKIRLTFQHWAEMHSLLGMPHKSVDKLTFEDFLKVKDRLVAMEVQLQELNNRAAGP